MALINELRMYILLNASVKMSSGKAVAQAGHGISEITEYLVRRNDPCWKGYQKGNNPKIALKCPQNLMEDLYDRYSDRSREIWCLNVIDQGRTQLPEGTMSAVVFKPMRKVDLPEEISNLKLY